MSGRRASTSGMQMMKAITIDRYGGPEVMQLRDIEVPRPGPGEALV